MIFESPPLAGFFVFNHLLFNVPAPSISFQSFFTFLNGLETTVFDFKISTSFQECPAVYDSEENKTILKADGITSLYGDLNKEDSSRAIVIFQGKDEKEVLTGLFFICRSDKN